MEKNKTLLSIIIPLLKTTPVEKISLEQISNALGIPVEQFKIQYPDLPTLIFSLLDKEAKRVTTINQAQNVNDLIEMLEMSKQFMSNSKVELYNLYFSKDRYILDDYLSRFSYYTIEYYVKKRCENTKITAEQQNKWISFYSEALYGIINRWISKGMETNHEKRLFRLATLVEKDIQDKINRTNESPSLE